MEPQLKLQFDKFCQYDEENPQVYEAFKKFALQAVLFRGNFGAKAIAERIRWETAVTRKGEFKLNNTYVSFFVRKFDAEFPEHKDFFKKRKSKFDQ